MAYNYLGLVNAAAERVNETKLDSSNFLTAAGVYGHLRQGVNASIKQINQMQFQWPFNHSTQNQTLTVGVNRYPFPSDAKSVDFDTIRIQRNDTFGNRTTLLKKITYDEYIDRYIDDEYNSDTGVRGVPTKVSESQNQEIVVHKIPDKEYVLSFEYFRVPAPLVQSTDVPTIPEQFDYIIVEGALRYAYAFRSDYENKDRAEIAFSNQIEDMRKIYINRNFRFTDTRIQRNGSS